MDNDNFTSRSTKCRFHASHSEFAMLKSKCIYFEVFEHFTNKVIKDRNAIQVTLPFQIPKREVIEILLILAGDRPLMSLLHLQVDHFLLVLDYLCAHDSLRELLDILILESKVSMKIAAYIVHLFALYGDGGVLPRHALSLLKQHYDFKISSEEILEFTERTFYDRLNTHIRTNKYKSSAESVICDICNNKVLCHIYYSQHYQASRLIFTRCCGTLLHKSCLPLFARSGTCRYCGFPLLQTGDIDEGLACLHHIFNRNRKRNQNKIPRDAIMPKFPIIGSPSQLLPKRSNKVNSIWKPF